MIRFVQWTIAIRITINYHVNIISIVVYLREIQIFLCIQIMFINGSIWFTILIIDPSGSFPFTYFSTLSLHTPLFTILVVLNSNIAVAFFCYSIEFVYTLHLIVKSIHLNYLKFSIVLYQFSHIFFLFTYLAWFLSFFLNLPSSMLFLWSFFALLVFTYNFRLFIQMMITFSCA